MDNNASGSGLGGEIVVAQGAYSLKWATNWMDTIAENREEDTLAKRLKLPAVDAAMQPLLET